MPENLVSLIIGYLIGSVPTAYLVVKQTSNVDIRNVGSGNVGGRNALDVTGKKSVGIIVVIIDVLKGVASVLIAQYLFNDPAIPMAFAMVGSVTGHCYPVWLKFKGGRGLATAAGVFLATSFILVAAWLGMYFVSSKISDNVHIASVAALVGTIAVAWVIPDIWLQYFTIDILSTKLFLIAGTLVISVCLTKHIQPLKELYVEKVK